jgi:hypothetical protein
MLSALVNNLTAFNGVGNVAKIAQQITVVGLRWACGLKCTSR